MASQLRLEDGTIVVDQIPDLLEQGTEIRLADGKCFAVSRRAGYEQVSLFNSHSAWLHILIVRPMGTVANERKVVKEERTLPSFAEPPRNMLVNESGGIRRKPV